MPLVNIRRRLGVGFGSIDAVIADEDTHDLAKNDFARLADLERDVALALERGRRLENARAIHMHARHLRQPCDIDFIDVWRKRNGAGVHGVNHCLIDNVDGELLGHPDVVAGVLEAHVGLVLDADGDDRRVSGQGIEETERGGVDDAVLVPSRVVAVTPNVMLSK